MTMSPLISAMIAAARKAGEGLTADRTRIASLTIHSKAGAADMFTEADLKAEATVRDALMTHAPDYGFLGEEGGLMPGRDPDHVWIVDPLDGTTNFLTGSPLFAVNIALAAKGDVVAGVTFVPAMDELFWAETGRGAWLGERRLQVSPRATLGESVLGVGIPFATKPRHEQFYAEMERLTPRVTGIRRLGAGAIDMAWVACGRHESPACPPGRGGGKARVLPAFRTDNDQLTIHVRLPDDAVDRARDVARPRAGQHDDEHARRHQRPETRE